MTEQSKQQGEGRKGRSRVVITIIAAVLIFSVATLAIWAFTALSLIHALATATPISVVVACGIVMVDGVAEVFEIVVDAIIAIWTAIAEAIGAILAAIAAALAAVFSIFGG